MMRPNHSAKPMPVRFAPASAAGRRSGLSLTELLVALALLAVLSSVLLASVSEERRAVLDSECRTILRQWGEAMWLYSRDNDDVYAVRHIWSNGGMSSWPALSSDYWIYFDLQDRFGEMRRCPLDVAETDGTATIGYAMNWPSLGPDREPLAPRERIAYGETERARSDLLLMVDAEWEGISDPHFAVPGNNRTAARGAEAVFALTRNGVERGEPPQRRHRGEMNAVFADGHVRRVHWEPRSENDRNSFEAQWHRWSSLNVDD